jgi:hypothetical protein
MAGARYTLLSPIDLPRCQPPEPLIARQGRLRKQGNRSFFLLSFSLKRQIKIGAREISTAPHFWVWYNIHMGDIFIFSTSTASGSATLVQKALTYATSSAQYALNANAAALLFLLFLNVVVADFCLVFYFFYKRINKA